MKLRIAIPVNDAYFFDFQSCLYSFKTLIPEDTILYIFDNGLSDKSKNILKRFDFIKYEIIKQPHLKDDKKAYRFKSKAISYMVDNILTEEHVFLMCDAKNQLKYNYLELEKILKEQSIYGGTESGTEGDWTDERAIIEMGFTNIEEIKKMPQIQSNGILVDYSNIVGREFLNNIIKYSKNDKILCPDGSYKGFNTKDPRTHRQDQSVLSLVIKKMNIKYKSYPYFTFHNTIHRC